MAFVNDEEPEIRQEACRLRTIQMNVEMDRDRKNIGSNLKKRTIKIFLCHAKEDSKAVKDLYLKLEKLGFSPWMDEIDILPGQNWNHEIKEAIKTSDFIIVCLSNSCVNKSGYINKEIKWALDRQDEMQHGSIFLIPVRLEKNCPFPEHLSDIQCVDISKGEGFQHLIKAIKFQLEKKGIKFQETNFDNPINSEDLNNNLKLQSIHSSNPLLNMMWHLFDEDLQDAISLAFNYSKRNGSNIIKTRFLFAAMKKLNPEPLNGILKNVPDSVLLSNMDSDITTKSDVLTENPDFSNCVANSCQNLRSKSTLNKITTKDIFVDLLKHGKGSTVAKLRNLGLDYETIIQKTAG